MMHPNSESGVRVGVGKLTKRPTYSPKFSSFGPTMGMGAPARAHLGPNLLWRFAIHCLKTGRGCVDAINAQEGGLEE
jgi:hypothetical protein